MSIDRNDLIGKTLKGKYTIEREIGNGGMGVVYLAQQATPFRKVAVKFLLPSRPVDNEAYKELLIRFWREVRIIKNLSHENIMPIFDSGKLYEGAYFVMPYIKLTLQKKLEDDGELSAYETLLYIEQATAALDYAHSRGIIHRDLKPLNFLLTADRKLILTDFGIARIAGSTLTQIGTFIGTEYYAAPEVKDGEPDIDLRADIYSLGVVLAVMLTGKNPWLINCEQATNLPALDAVIRKATKQNRRDRFQTAGELARALRAAVEGEHGAPTVIQPDSPELPRRQRSRLWIAGIVIVFVIIIFGIWATTQNNDLSGIFIPPHHPSVQPENSAIKQAEAAVNEYYSDWNRKNYAAAYN